MLAVPASAVEATPPRPALHAIPAQPGPPVEESARTTTVVTVVPGAASLPEPATVIRLERGSATPEEIAAVATVLLARAAVARAAAAGGRQSAGVRRAPARWRVHGFAGPRAWTTDARDLLAS